MPGAKPRPDEDDGRAARSILLGREQAPGGRANAEGRQKRVRREQSACWRDRGSGARGVVPECERSRGLECTRLVAKVDVVGIRGALESGPWPDGDDPWGVPNSGWLTEEQGVDDADERDDRSHADGERRYDRHGRARRPDDAAEHVSQVGSQTVECGARYLTRTPILR